MPLITWAVAAYAAGLLLGFANAVSIALVVSVAAIVVGHLRAWPGSFACALLLNAGAGVATLHQWHEARCIPAAVARGSVTLDLLTAAAPGQLARGRVADGCPVRMAISVRSGEAPAGARVRVEGPLFATGDGLLAKRAAVTLERAPGLLARIRARTARNLTRDFGTDAPLARALLIADMSDISPELRDSFARAGLVHILSISGLHVTIVALAVVLILEAARLPRRVALIGGAILTATYVALIGAPPPAVRSAVMFCTLAAARLLQRPTTAWAALALGAGWPLPADPAVVLDIGWQLTVAGMVALIAAGHVNRRLIMPRLTGWRRRLASELSTGVLASLVTAPLVAWYFGRTSMVAPLANLAANPVANLLQPTLFLALALGWWPAAAGWVADACRPGLHALQLTVHAAAALPGADVATVPTLATTLLTMAAIVALLAAIQARRPQRWTLAALAALTAIVWWPITARPSGEFELHMLDVGQGDALALRTPRGRWIIVDAGRSWRGGDAGRRVVVPYVRRLGGEVALFILSHPDEDHVGGAKSVVEALRPRAYWDAAFVAANESYLGSLAAAARRDVSWRRVRPGDTTTVDGVRLRVLAPDSAWTAAQRDPNEASVVVMAEYGSTRMLLTGDAEAGEERWLAARWGADLRADVLKAGHHGSKTSSTSTLLDVVRPRLALVSVGAGNTYGHPSPSVLSNLAERGVLTLRTDQLGSIVVASDGRRVRVRTRDGHWAIPPQD